MKDVATLDELHENIRETEPERFIALELAGKVIAVRNRKGLSQSELARRSGVPQKTISRMENGLSKPSIMTFYKLINAMDCSLEFTIKKNRKE